MGPIRWFLFVYILGGITFLPLLLGLLLLHAHYTLPTKTDADLPPTDDPAGLKRDNDDKINLKTATDTLEEQFHRKHETDVAAGYFAVCREYVPGGVNGKPPERTTPAGEVVATESPSVYQSMYRSIFDRQQKPTIEPNKTGGKTVKKANNVFFVVLRHGHLMLYDDSEQLEVRYVISLEYHDVSIYSGGDAKTPEGELFIKRNAIRLTRKPTSFGGGASSLPFFLFSENTSEKEDFYFALLKNQEKLLGPSANIPAPETFDAQHIVTLVRELHSSEEHMQTRWLNAMIGRLFLSLYKTPEMEMFIREKLAKKISRVKKPLFITRIALHKIDMGNGGPFITNPRLKDLTFDGDCCVEADLKYAGNFRIEIAATARVDLGKRFGAREVELVLAVVAHKLEGHVLVKFKPPPSNRIWFTFETMPKVDMTIEPIVSSRQITYSIILRAIESRVREVIAESIVLPFWDDIPFLTTFKERYRGGIWKKEHVPTQPQDIKAEVYPEDEAEAGGELVDSSIKAMKNQEARTVSTPALAMAPNGLRARGGKEPSIHTLPEVGTQGLSSSIEKPSFVEPPRMMRSTSFASAADPTLTPNHADRDGSRQNLDTARQHDASVLLQNLSSRSITASPSESPAGTPPIESTMTSTMTSTMKINQSDTTSSKASNESIETSHRRQHSAASSIETPNQASLSSTPTTGTFDSKRSSLNEDTKAPRNLAAAARSLTQTDRKQALASINAAAGAAQKWGWGVLNRNKNREAEGGGTQRQIDAPMGRGRPLPPPGVPLPPPDRSSTLKAGSFTLPRRRPVPPPLLPKRPEANGTDSSGTSSPSKPTLPQRRARPSSFQDTEDHIDDVLVVEAPLESAPTSPTADEHHDEFFGHGEAEDDPWKSPPPPLMARAAFEPPDQAQCPEDEPDAPFHVPEEAHEDPVDDG